MKKMLLSVIIFGSLSVGMGQTLYINEVMAKQGAHDDCLWYDCSDFFEIFNPGTEAVDIGGWYVTDDLNNPTAFQLSDAEPEVTTVQPGGFLLIFADKHPTYGPLHVSFGLSSGGESVALVQPDGSFMDSLSFGEWPVDTSFGRSPDGGTTAGTLVDNWEWYYKPSPGRSNITVRINEFLAKNDNVNQDENGNFSDWVELYNYGESDVDIGGMSMTDDYTTPTQYTIPSGTTIPAQILDILTQMEHHLRRGCTSTQRIRPPEQEWYRRTRRLPRCRHYADRHRPWKHSSMNLKKDHS